MAYRQIPFVAGEYYHVYNRGNSKQKIFLDDYDCERFTKLLYLCNSTNKFDFRDDIVRAGIDAWDFEIGKQLVSIGAWVLMPNHFHLYLTPHDSRMSDVREKELSEYMRKLLTSYSKYFNAKHERTGGLFEGNFRSTHMETDPQAKYNFSYIHLNPVKLIDKDWKQHGVKNIPIVEKFLKEYRWSSYQDYKNIKRKENAILSRGAFPDYFQNTKSFDTEILDWLMYYEKTF